MNIDRRVRVRFAPSPTGPLHIGGVRTALYNYLFAKQNGGDMILRIEDTDSQRFVPGAEEYIKEALEWLGIKFDEGVGYGGKYGPYRQSERRDIYRKYVKQLLDSGKAYIAFDTPSELEEKRNGELGAALVGLDGILLVGETRVSAVSAGYLNAGGDGGKLRTLPTLREAQLVLKNELKAGDTVLFLNDLPDTY